MPKEPTPATPMGARDRIVAALQEHGEPLNSAEVATLLDMPPSTASGRLSLLERAGQVLSDGGRPRRYRPNPAAPKYTPVPRKDEDLRTIATVWKATLGVALTPDDVRLALQVADRIRQEKGVK